MDSTSLPETYQALVPVKPGDTPKIDTLPLPKPGNNQILVKIAFAPIHPADIYSIYGQYARPADQSTPLIGFEGSGTVVALGENLKIPFNIGQKVHVRGPGTMAQYILVETTNAYPVQGDLSLEQAAPHSSNPATVVYMGVLAQRGGHKAAIHTVGSSALGRILIRYLKEKGIKLINIVRKDEFIEELQTEGADYVLNSTAPDFEAQLKEVAEKEQATISFDAIAGDFTSKVITAQPAGSVCYIYGALGGRTLPSISIMELFKGKTITAFSVATYHQELAKTGKTREVLSEIHTKLETTFKSNVQKVFKLEDIVEALAYYEKNSSKGKILLQPN